MYKYTVIGSLCLLFLMTCCICVADMDEKPAADETWTTSDARIKIKSAGKNLCFNWAGGLNEAELYSKNITEVTSGTYLEFMIEWQSKSWNYNSMFYPVLHFYSEDGKLLETQKAFSNPAKGKLPHASPPAPEFFYGTPPNEWGIYKNLIKVPANAKSCRIGLVFKGNPAECVVKKIEIKSTDFFDTPAIFTAPAYNHEYKELTDSEVGDVLLRRVRAEGKIKRVGDMNCMFVNGKKINPFIYRNGTIAPSMGKQLARCATFGKAGFPIFTVALSLGKTSYSVQRELLWQGENQYDVSKLEDAVYNILRYNPDAYIFLELIVTPYHEWTVKNPDDIYQNSKGEKGIMRCTRVWENSFSQDVPPKESHRYWMPSYFSEKYNNDVMKALKDIFSRFEKTSASKAVLGIYLNGGADNQWLDIYEDARECADYCPAALSSFKSYLRKKYNGNEALLKREWNDSKASFESVKMPYNKDVGVVDFSFGRHSASWQSDFYEWMSETLTARQIRWCEAVKDATGGRLLVGSHWCESGLAGFATAGHRSSRKIYESAAVDFISVVPNYNISREAAQNIRLDGAYNGSLLLHEKLLVMELDIRNEELSTNFGFWGNKFYLEKHDAQTFYNKLLRYVGYSMALGGTFHAYDMDGGWWDTPAAVKAWKNACDVASKAVPQPLTRARLAVFTDETSAMYISHNAKNGLFPYALKEHISDALWRAGIRFDHYIPEDIFNPGFEAPSVLIFNDASCMTPETAAKIREKFGCENRVFVWFWAPGIFAKGNDENMSKITGFHLVEAPEAYGTPVFVAEQSDPITKGVKGFLHQPLWNKRLQLGPAWRVEDGDAKILANYYGTDIPAMAVKRYKNHTEIYIGQPGAFTPRLCRNIAREAGIIPLIESDSDVSRYGAGLFVVSGRDGGEKTITIPIEKYCIKNLTGQNIEILSANTFSYYQKAYDTAIFNITNKGKNDVR